MDLSLDDVNNNASFLNVRYLVENDSSTCNRGFEFDFFFNVVIVVQTCYHMNGI